MKDLLLGIDVGTSGTKCTIYDFCGSLVASAYTEYPMIKPRPMWVEQDPNRWWKAVCNNLHNCFDVQKIESNRIAAIGISGTNAVVPVDSQGNPTYNALGLHDNRSTAELEWLKAHIPEEIVLAHSGNRLAGGSFALPRLKWLQLNPKEQFARAYKILTPGGYIIQHLTGEFTINHSRANLTLLSNIYSGEWDETLLDLAQFPVEKLPKSIPSCSVAGTVSAKAAKETGLVVGTPVSAGAVDTVHSTLASGAVNPGDVAITIGSSGRICYISEHPIPDKRLLNCESPISNLYTIIQTTNSAGVSLRWFRDIFGSVVEKGARDSGNSLYTQMCKEAEKVPAGANGLLYLPYLDGEQSPIWDADAKGVFYGMGLNSDFGSFTRSVLEGVAYSIKSCLEIVQDHNDIPEFIPIGGGVANSPLWCQIFADVLNTQIVRVSQPETETLGDVITAAQSIGIREVPFTLGKQLAAQGTVFEPNASVKSVYDEQYARFRELYHRVQGL